jgi:hypothetical protein
VRLVLTKITASLLAFLFVVTPLAPAFAQEDAAQSGGHEDASVAVEPAQSDVEKSASQSETSADQAEVKSDVGNEEKVQPQASLMGGTMMKVLIRIGAGISWPNLQ